MCCAHIGRPKDPVFEHSLYQKLPEKTFSTRWVTTSVKNVTNLHLEIAVHPWVLHSTQSHTVGKVTTTYTTDDLTPVLSEPKILMMRQGSLIFLDHHGSLHFGKCRKNGHLRRVCEVVTKRLQALPFPAGTSTGNHGSSTQIKNSNVSSNSVVVPLMDIKFPNASLPRLEKLRQKFPRYLNALWVALPAF